MRFSCLPQACRQTGVAFESFVTMISFLYSFLYIEKNKSLVLTRRLRFLDVHQNGAAGILMKCQWETGIIHVKITLFK